MAVFSQSNGIDDNATMFVCKLQQRKKEKRNNAHAHAHAHAHAMAATPFRTKGRSLLNFSHTPSFLSLSDFLIFMHVCSHSQTHLVLPPTFSLPCSLSLSICMSRSRHAHLLSFVSLSKLNLPFLIIFDFFFLLSQLVSPPCYIDQPLLLSPSPTLLHTPACLPASPPPPGPFSSLSVQDN